MRWHHYGVVIFTIVVGVVAITVLLSGSLRAPRVEAAEADAATIVAGAHPAR